MAYREIPEGSVEIQTGLWLHSSTFTVNGVEYPRRHLYSSEGYCFYDITEEIYDEEGNLIPSDEVTMTQRTYFQYASLGLYKDVNDYVSVPVDDSYNILTKPNDSVVA